MQNLTCNVSYQFAMASCKPSTMPGDDLQLLAHVLHAYSGASNAKH